MHGIEPVTHQILGLDVTVEDLPEQAVVLLVLDVEHEAAVLVLVLHADLAVVQVEQALLDFVAQLEAKVQKFSLVALTIMSSIYCLRL